MDKLRIKPGKEMSKPDISKLHIALKSLHFKISNNEISEKSMGKSSIESIKKIQGNHRLSKKDGVLDQTTLDAINDELFHSFITENKYRVEKLHSLLEKIGKHVDAEEKKARKFGKTSMLNLSGFMQEKGLKGKIITEKVFSELEETVIKKTYKTKTKIGQLQKLVLKATKVAKLDAKIDIAELKKKEVGNSTKALIKAFQKKYKISPTDGEINKITIDKMSSVAASKGTYVKKLKKPQAKDLSVVTKTLRLNMISPKVALLQKSLSYLGYIISEKEFEQQVFGKTTAKAIQKFQKENSIAHTGHYDKQTSSLLNQQILTSNPGAIKAHRYRIRGSVRNELWQSKNQMIIKIFEKFIDKESDKPLVIMRNLINGFFDIAYDAPIDPTDGQIKKNFHLVIKLYNVNDQEHPIAVQTHYNVNQIHWVNFTGNKNKEGDIVYNGKYIGKSEFEITRKMISHALDGYEKIINIKETTSDKQISQLSFQTGLTIDNIMQHILSNMSAKSINNKAVLNEEVFYAFVRQNIPTELPGDLLRSTDNWNAIDQLAEIATSGIVFLDKIIQQQVIDNALSQNLVSQNLLLHKTDIIDKLQLKKNSFTLTKPILVGNGNLQSLLDQSSIDNAHYQTVANVFINSKGINPSFWAEIKEHEEEIGKEKITDFASTVEVGNITFNHIPTIAFLKSKIGNDAGKLFKTASDIAKLDQNDLVKIINQNGNQIPEDTPGSNLNEKVSNYAAALKSRSEILFPAVSLVAKIKCSNVHTLQKVSKVEEFIDNHKDLDFRNQNIDKYLINNNIKLDPDNEIAKQIKEEIKVVQRVNKLTSNSVAGTTLIEEGLHSSMQIYFIGKDRLTEMMKAKGVEPAHIHCLYESSRMQYMQILARLTEYRREIHRYNPKMLISHTYSKDEIINSLGDIPDLETLFGSMDYCDCEHCKSLYSPAAYLTDMFRFLKEHNSLVESGGKRLTVKDVLFDRRPDLGNIKLNCLNTDTALPYIDLVCEILENNIEPKQKNFSYQSTMTQKELRAFPQYIRPHAYTILANSDFPIFNSFNLWQEEIRTYLNFLRVPRFELMDAFQDKSDENNKKPDDSSIAAEYFGISAKEKELITTKRQSSSDQNMYWELDTTQASTSVMLFMKRTGLSYYELLELLLVRFVNNPATPPTTKIERPVETCDTEKQNLINLTASKYDLMHRFIRLWRKTGWKMWELDLLVRNGKIGKNEINNETLINLKLFKQLQDKLKLPFEILLAFYGEINREIRFKPEKPEILIQPLYNVLFQNKAVTNQVDTYFKAINDNNIPIELDTTITFGINSTAPYNGYTPVPTVLSALSLRQTDLDLLIRKTDEHLSIASLSTITRYAYIARSLKIDISDFLILLGTINNILDPFSTVKITLDLIKYLEHIKISGLSIRELDYILNYNTDSPIGLRAESIIQLIDCLRRILISNKERIKQLKLNNADKDGILSFDADALIPMTDAQLVASLSQLTSILKNVIENFTEATFCVQETKYIINYNTTSITDAGKTELVKNIKILQQNLSDLFDSNKNQIKAHVSTSFGLTNEQASVILENLKIMPGLVDLMGKLCDESLIILNPDGTYKEITSLNFPDHFKIYTLLHKVSLLTTKMEIEIKDLTWFIMNHTEVKTLDFSSLPVGPIAVLNDFEKWHNLCLFLNFRSKFPEPENSSIRSMLDLAKDCAKSKAEIFNEISKLTQWASANIKDLDAKLNIKHIAGNLDYTNAELYERFLKCFDQMRLTGVDATTMSDWASVDMDTNLEMKKCNQCRQAVKSKYEQDDWLQKITPLYDEIRENKRKALVDYHLENSQRNQQEKIVFKGVEIPNPLYWKDTNALFKYFLIDVEMTSCQLTSRIKQALSSVQLFVQRCFLNLENRYVEVIQDEKEDTSSPNAWSQWKWMKNYRIWEANRKIFFYPENWLEPELRDDKSPFFKELENELMQNEITKENVENAFQNYLHRVDEVSHLEVCGMYHQMEDLNPDEAGYEKNLVHIIGRTKSIPHIYYYRTYDMNYNSWSAWEKVDIDITGDHVVPVIYNRKLHLFWLQFSEKPMKTKKIPAAQPSDGPTDSPDPLKTLEIQLGWSIKKQGGWSSKRISKQKLIHPWERPFYIYNLKPFYSASLNLLYLDIYLSTSKEFNDGSFYDPYVLRTNNPVKLTLNRFNETYLPWHSSSFVFNGEIERIEVKGLNGSYHLEPDVNSLVATDSYNYIHTNFDPQGNTIAEMQPENFGPRLRLPGGMHFSNTHLANNQYHNINTGSLRVLENTITKNPTTVNLLNGSISPFELVITQQDLQFDTINYDHPFFYQDNQRAFFIKPEWQVRLNTCGKAIGQNRKYRFMPFYHPYTLLFLREFNRDGIESLLKRKIQVDPESYPPFNTFKFSTYSPTNSVVVDKTAQTDLVDFSYSGSYSIYNWELFFHSPLMIACRLMQNQKFEDAMNWFHYIFKPNDIENYPVPQRYWVTKPFFEYNSDEYRKQRIESILSNLNLKENADQLKAWRNDPFKPHVIARYRPVAYQKNVVMKYLDNLISWGDMLFKRDTIESINEASLLYMLAYEILGDRPIKVPNVKHEELTFNELEPKLDEFGNARIDVIVEDTLLPITVIPTSSNGEPIPRLDTFYFCIPNNEYLTKYWDTVEDRLFKIRHCMNIEGIVRQLPLFEPPIDPALLVKAAAAGLDLGSVLNDLSAPTPFYRFRIVVQKAIEFCNEVKALGEKLLSALEKKDVEKLSLLRSQHEIQLLEAIKEIRKTQINEAVETIGSLNKAKELAEDKKSYYDGIPRMNDWEIAGVVLHGGAIISEIVATVLNTIGGVSELIPATFTFGAAGFGGSPVFTTTYGSSNIAKSSVNFAALFQGLSTILHSTGNLIDTQGSYTRRDEENKHQSSLASIEIDQIQFQINAAEIRQAIAEKELENQELQIENAKTVDESMRNKYTNEQLYNWMITQISTVYFQAYQLAYDMAKKAEKCYQHELSVTDSNIIQFGYWDSLKKGLLSGDMLINSLRKLETEYMNQNRREFEITKHISLVQMAPQTLITLKETGKCSVSLPEWLFDMDYPGQYMRRIKKVSISIPCVVGPYTNVNCTLSLLKSEIRMDSTLSGGAYEKQEDDTRFRTIYGAISSIATSSAQNDSGLFELNFNDERYLPFEGLGAISDWQINMPIENNYFDFSTLSDVILHISYTSRQGGEQLAGKANAYLNTIIPNQTARLFSLKHEFATEWNKFLNPGDGNEQEMKFNISDLHYPYFIRSKLNSLKIKILDLIIESELGEDIDFTTCIKVTNKEYLDGLNISKDPGFNNIHHLLREFAQGSCPNSIGEIRLKLKIPSVKDDYKSLTSDQVSDIYLLLQLSV
jgi:hypothetical protein